MSKSVTPEGVGGRPITEAHPTTADGFDAERAAILEYDGGIPRAYAEAFAPMQHCRPVDMTEAQWRRAIDDAGRFLDRWGEAAAALGWSVTDLFELVDGGCCGLVWELDGRSVLALTTYGATLGENATTLRAWFARASNKA